MAEKLTVAIIGAGQIAGGYDRSKSDDGIYTHAGAYLADGRFSLQTICDLDADRAADFQRQWQVAHATTDLETIYRSRHDVVSVCTPDATHFPLIVRLIKARCCRTIFAEKPLSLELDEIGEVERLSAEHGVKVVVNFQRQFDPAHRRIRELLASGEAKLVTGSGIYIKGLEHIGITMLDTLTFLCGAPREVLAFNRVHNRQVDGYSYEFILFYDGFNVTVKTADSEGSLYNYHIFEIDLLLADRRITINDNSRQIVTRGLVDYAYSGVRVLNDRSPEQAESGYSRSMLGAAAYLHDITTGKREHDTNTPATSYLHQLVIDSIVKSYETGEKVALGATSWKR